MLGADPPQSLDQVIDPSWLTAAVGASASVSEAFRARELSRPRSRHSTRQPSTQRTVEAWNDLVSSDRARLLPRASLVREAKRLFETGSIDKGRCPSAARRWTQDPCPEN